MRQLLLLRIDSVCVRVYVCVCVCVCAAQVRAAPACMRLLVWRVQTVHAPGCALSLCVYMGVGMKMSLRLLMDVSI